MNIVVKKVDYSDKWIWMADRPELCGSPIVGYGTTWQNALANLICLDQKKFGYEIKIQVEDDENDAIM